MTDYPAAKAAFAPVWPRVYKAPAGKELIPPYGRVRVFNRDLTIAELEPLIESFPVPGRTLRRIGGYTFVSVGVLSLVLWLATLTAALIFSGTEVSEADEQNITDFIKATFSAAASLGGWAALAAIGPVVAGIAVDFVSWKKWGDALAVMWGRYEGRMVRTVGLPGQRKQKSDNLCRRLDKALKQLDAHDPAARSLDSTARQAISRYIDFPVTTRASRRVSESTVDEASIRQIREEYEAATAAETAALEHAESAVLAVEESANQAKAAAADQEIIRSWSCWPPEETSNRR